MADSEEPLRPGSYSCELELREIRERYDGWARTKVTRGRRRAAALEELVRGRRRLGQALERRPGWSSNGGAALLELEWRRLGAICVTERKETERS